MKRRGNPHPVSRMRYKAIGNPKPESACPVSTSPDEIERVRVMLARAHEELEKHRLPGRWESEEREG